eukprot:1734232-Rhodomonas_salina.1
MGVAAAGRDPGHGGRRVADPEHAAVASLHSGSGVASFVLGNAGHGRHGGRAAVLVRPRRVARRHPAALAVHVLSVRDHLCLCVRGVCALRRVFDPLRRADYHSQVGRRFIRGLLRAAGPRGLPAIAGQRERVAQAGDLAAAPGQLFRAHHDPGCAPLRYSLGGLLFRRPSWVRSRAGGGPLHDVVRRFWHQHWTGGGVLPVLRLLP